MRQKLGQHFLKNEGVLRKITAASGIAPGDTVIEIGPGHGELTRYLVEAVSQNGKVIALERDAELGAELSRRFANMPQFELRIGNAIETLSGAAPGKDYVLIGNIPYYLTGFLLRRIEQLSNKPRRTVLTIQKEVAERIIARPPDMNRLSAAVRFWAEPKIIGLVSRNDFAPPPEVDSATILLKTREGATANPAYYRAVNAIFKQPRKTILNNLEEGTGRPKADLELSIKDMGLNPAARPQDLEVRDIELLASKLF